MDKLFFTAGLPRSGSTILHAILNQNPEIYASSTSGLLQILYKLRTDWESIPEHRASRDESELQKVNLFKSIPVAYYAHIDKPVVFDKCRAWPAEIELMERVLGHKIKMLVTIRDLRDVLASWELLHRNNPLYHKQIEVKDYLNSQTLQGRLQIYTSGDQPIGVAFNRIKDAIQRGLRDRLHFVHYEELCRNPARTMAGIYEFFELTPYKHDFENITPTSVEDDRVYGFDNLHKVRPTLKPQKSKWREVLGDAAKPYAIDWHELTA